MPSETEMLATLIERNSDLFTTYEGWANAQVMLLAGTIDDPDSFNAEGGSTGALGYYPVVNVSDQTIYVPSLARLQIIAAAGGDGDLSAIEALLSDTVDAKNAAVTAKEEAIGALSGLDGRVAVLEYGAGLQITSFTATPSVIELGATSAIALAWTIAGTVTGQTMADSVAGAVALANPVTDRAKSAAGVNSARTFTLTASNTGAPGGTDTKSRQVSVAQQPRRFWGVADAATLDSAGVIALANSELNAGRAKSFSVDAGAGSGKYVYYAYLASLGAHSLYKLFTLDDDAVVTTVSVTPVAGLTVNYLVLRSPNKLTGTVSEEIG